MKCRIFFFVLACFLLVSCRQNAPERVIKDFYYSYQNLDFEKSKTYCAPSMVDKIELIEANFNAEKKERIQSEIQKYHIEIKDITYKDNREHAVAKISFSTKEDTLTIDDEVTLERRGDEWKIVNF